MQRRPAPSALVAVCALLTTPLSTSAIDEPDKTTPVVLSATQIASKAPVVNAGSPDTRFHLDIRARCGEDASARLAVMVADTAVSEDRASDSIDLPEFSISVPSAQLSGLQPATLCPRLLRSGKRGDGQRRFAVPAAFTALVSLRCTDGAAQVRTAYRAVALDALIECGETSPEDEAKSG